MGNFKSKVLLPLQADPGGIVRDAAKIGFVQTERSLSDIASEIGGAVNRQGGLNYAIPSPLAHIQNLWQLLGESITAGSAAPQSQDYLKWLGAVFMIALDGVYSFGIEVRFEELAASSAPFNSLLYRCINEEQGRNWPQNIGTTWDQAMTRLVVFQRYGKPIAFIHPETGFCPYKEIDKSILSDVDWYDMINNQWLDPVAVVFTSGPAANPQPHPERKKIASALYDWLKELYSFGKADQGVTISTMIFKQAYQLVATRLQRLYGNFNGIGTPLGTRSLKVTEGLTIIDIQRQLDDQLVSGSVLKSVYIGVDIPTVFTDTVLVAARSMLPNIGGECRVPGNPHYVFLPPLTAEFANGTGYSVDTDQISFQRDGAGQSEIIRVTVPLYVEATQLKFERTRKYLTNKHIRFLASVKYISVWPAVEIPSDLWACYYTAVFHNDSSTYAPFSHPIGWLDEAKTITQDSIAIQVIDGTGEPAVFSAIDTNRGIDSSLPISQAQWYIHKTKVFPRFLSVSVRDNNIDEFSQAGVIPLKARPAAVSAERQVSYGIGVDFGTTNTYCALGQLYVSGDEQKALPTHIYHSETMLPLDVTSAQDAAGFESLKSDISTLFWLPANAAADNAQSLAIVSSISQMFNLRGLNDELKPMIDGRIMRLASDGIYRLFGEKNRSSLLDMNIYDSMKVPLRIGARHGDTNTVVIRNYLTNTLLNAALHAILHTGAKLPLPLAFAYPNADFKISLNDAFNMAIKYANSVADVQLFHEESEQRGYQLPGTTEAFSVSNYFRYTPIIRLPLESGYVTVDIGGGTTDISLSQLIHSGGVKTLKSHGTMSVGFAGRRMLIDTMCHVFKHAGPNAGDATVGRLVADIFDKVTSDRLMLILAELTDAWMTEQNGGEIHKIESSLMVIIETIMGQFPARAMRQPVASLLTLRSLLRAKVIALCYLVAKFLKSHADTEGQNFDLTGVTHLSICFAGNGSKIIDLCGLNTTYNKGMLNRVIQDISGFDGVKVNIILPQGVHKTEVAAGLLYLLRERSLQESRQNNPAGLFEGVFDEGTCDTPIRDNIALTPDRKTAQNIAYAELLCLLESVIVDENQKLMLSPPIAGTAGLRTLFSELSLETPGMLDLYEAARGPVTEMLGEYGIPDSMKDTGFAVVMLDEIIRSLSGQLF